MSGIGAAPVSPVDVEAAIREFVGSEYPRVVAAVGHATGQPDVAEDAVQDALIKVLEDGHRPRRLAAWVTVVAINILRARHRRSRAEERATRRMEHAPADDAASGVPERVAVLEAVDRLPDGQRVAVLLHYYLDAAVADIATALGVSEGTVKTQLHRGRRALAAVLGEEET
jgi:RNA polymerase sigma-70 factor (ECF subfamily)